MYFLWRKNVFLNLKLIFKASLYHEPVAVLLMTNKNAKPFSFFAFLLCKRTAKAIFSMLRFTQTSTTLLLVAVYTVVFTGVLLSNSTSKIPEDKLGLDLNEAYYDLHQVRYLSI